MRRLRVRPRQQQRLFGCSYPPGLAVLALTLTSSSFAVVNLDSHSTGSRDFDSRGKVAPTTAQLRAARSIHGRVSWGPLGTPASVIHYGGYLAAGIKAPYAESAALSWLAAHKAAFGLRSVKNLRVLTSAPLRGSKAHAVSFRQTFGDALSADGVVTVTVVQAKTGWKVVYASSSLARDQAVVGKRSLSPVRAWIKAASAAGIHVSSVGALGKTADGATAISAAGLSGSETVRPTVFGTARKGAIRAYDTTVTRSIQGAQDSYRVIVDAATGKLLYRQNLVDNLASDPVWSAFSIAPPFNPLNAFPWNYPSTDTRQTYCWTATAGCTNVVSDDPQPRSTRWASPRSSSGTSRWTSWATRACRRARSATTSTRRFCGAAAAGRTTTRPTRARSARPATTRRRTSRGRTSGSTPRATRRRCSRRDRPGPRRTRTSRTGRLPRSTSSSATTGCTTTRTTSAGTRATGTPSSTTTASARSTRRRRRVARRPRRSATTPSWAVPGRRDQRRSAWLRARDNANMGTGADGQHPSTNMFLWQPLPASFYAPCVDGDYDFTVFAHEFGHAIENRMIGKGVGARQGFPAGAMGEAFGDFDALEFVNEPHRTGPGLGSLHRGRVRHRQRLQRHPRLPRGPADGREFPAARTEPRHRSAELRRLRLRQRRAGGARRRRDLDRDRRSTCATCSSSGTRRAAPPRTSRALRGQTPEHLPGRPPLDPALLRRDGDDAAQPDDVQDARDAKLAADMARFGGANQDLLWQGFALRGFGQFAQTNTTSDSGNANAAIRSDARLLVAAREQRDVDLLRRRKGTRSVPVNAKIYVGDYQARSDADRGHRPGHESRRDAKRREPRQHGAVRADLSRTRALEALVDVQLHRRSRPATAWCGST